MTSAPSDLVGQRLEDYTLEARIGAGATGVVYRARGVEDGRELAIKVLNQNLGQVAALRRRFEREARALTQLTHPRIVHISDFGVTEQATYIAMELLRGDTLEELLAAGPVPVDSAVSIVEQALEGLAFAHELKIVHRDLKPANVFVELIDGRPDVKVLDFGLAKFLSVDELSDDSTLTRRGRIVGTPAYMSPEQIAGAAVDARADVYAAGVLLFELLADRRPFDYPKRTELLRAHLFEPAPKLASMRAGLEVKPALEAVVRRALEKDPAKRYADAAEMLAALLALPERSARLAPREPGRRHPRAPSPSEAITTGERLAVTMMSTASGELVLTETMIDREPLGSVPPPRLANTSGQGSGAALWWIAGVTLSLASGVAAFFAVRGLG